MKLICRSTIMKTINKDIRKFCLLLVVFAICLVSACGKPADEVEEEEIVAENEIEQTAEEEQESIEETSEEPEEPIEEDLQSEEEEQSSQESEAPVTMAQLMGGTDDGKKAAEAEELSDTILWFNATYAPLTYSNGWNWRLISGLEMTEANQDIQKYLLGSSWSIYNREQALETIDRLKEKGHRESCRKCMEELEELGMLDLGEVEFAKEFETFLESHTDGNPLRYIVAYYIHQGGMDADYIAAWDLCRVNQLYADCYFCGYLTYEEAMDGSLENSLVLQHMYSSWEEMISSYMLGYQFWQGDLMITDDSPTMERYRYYEMLLEKADGPYTLDWDMKLEKDW